MLFKKLELINFKSHAHTTIDFNEGISLIVGENGAGKSSVFEAITFALFTESLITNKDLVRTNKGLNDKIVMEVKLTFDASGNDYRVERKVTKKNDKVTSAAKLIQINDSGEDTIAQKVTEVNNEIQQIINMDSKTYLNAIHIRQGEISSLIDEKPADRKKLIGQLLRIDDLEKAYKEMSEITKTFENKADKLKIKIENDGDLNSQLDDLNKNKNTFIEENTELTNNLEDFIKENDEKTNEKAKLDQQKAKLDNLKLKHESEQKQFDILNKSKEELDNKYEEILNNEKEMITLKPLTDKLKIYSDFKESLLKFNHLKKEEHDLTETLGKITQYKEIISTEQETYDKYIKLEKELKDINIEKTKLESEVKQIDEFETQKQEKQTDIEKKTDSLNQLYVDLENDLSQYNTDKLDIKTKKLDEIEEFIESLKSNVKNLINEFDEKIKENTNSIGGLDQEIKSSKKPLAEIKKVENKCPTCQSEISEDQKNKLINEYEVIISDDAKKIAELNKLNDELNQKKSLKNDELTKLEAIKNNISKHKHLPEQIEIISQELKTIDDKLVEFTTKKEELSKLIKSTETKTSEFESLKKGYDNYVESQTLLNNQKDEEELKKQLDTISKDIVDFNKKLNELIESDSKLSFEISEEELNKEIDKLSEKNDVYNKLAGSVKYKEEYETKIKQNEEDIKNKESKLESIVKTIESCTYDEEVHKNTINSVEKLSKTITDLKTTLAVNEEKLKSIEEQTKDLAVKIEENKKYVGEYEATMDYLELLNDFREHYGKNGIQKDLRSQSRPIIQSYTQGFFDKFNFNYSELQLTDEYDISIFGPEGKITLDMVSGGEKIAIALSLRLAITQAMSKGNIETILLDEPTIHLDNFRRQELINVLRSMKIIPQMIIVTHDSELETAADTLIKIEKEDGISKVIDD